MDRQGWQLVIESTEKALASSLERIEKETQIQEQSVVRVKREVSLANELREKLAEYRNELERVDEEAPQTAPEVN